MTYWLDAHLDPDLAAWIGSAHKVIVLSIREIGLRDAKDIELFNAAKRFGPVSIVTKDKDLADLVHQLGPPPQIVWVKLGNMRSIRLRNLLVGPFAEVIRLVDSG